jgi:hypothetical protein
LARELKEKMRRRIDRPAERHWDDSMEREFEERIEARQRHSGDRGTRGKSAEKSADRSKAPLLLRILTWCGVVLFCFVMGYLGTSYALKLLDRKSLLKQEGAPPGQQEAEVRGLEILPGADRAADGLGAMQKKTLSLFYPKEGVLTEEKTEIISGTFEDDIRDVVLRLLERSELFGGGVRVEHVFRDGTLVYLDFSGSFASALASAGEKASALFITGIVRTMRDSFSIARVRFLLDSKVSSGGAPVNLTATWQMPQ